MPHSDLGLHCIPRSSLIRCHILILLYTVSQGPASSDATFWSESTLFRKVQPHQLPHSDLGLHCFPRSSLIRCNILIWVYTVSQGPASSDATFWSGSTLFRKVQPHQMQHSDLGLHCFPRSSLIRCNILIWVYTVSQGPASSDATFWSGSTLFPKVQPHQMQHSDLGLHCFPRSSLMRCNILIWVYTVSQGPASWDATFWSGSTLFPKVQPHEMQHSDPGLHCFPRSNL